VVDDISSLPERVANSPASSSRDGVGLCLSGGGYRAMLFHVGALWRLNEIGWLRRLFFVSSVSGGSITAGLVAVKRRFSKPYMRDWQVGGVSVVAASAAFPPVRSPVTLEVDPAARDVAETKPSGNIEPWPPRTIKLSDGGVYDNLGLQPVLRRCATILVSTLKVGDDVLFLPGDAQWGPWQAILGNAHTVALINRTTFYKVKITAGISVNPVTQWPNIPERALVNQLNRQMTIFQASKPPPANTNIFRLPASRLR
jgi:predicted acylesterase/phospholipase RssA